MCTLAGYVGENNAAPILIEMSKRQEGIWAGYYAGLTTLSEDNLHLDKVVGDTKKLEDETDAGSFEGTIGIVHSRTNSGGGREWGQPFIDGSKAIACAGQGCSGFFSANERRIRLGNTLVSEGVAFRTAVPEPIGSYPVLTNGNSIHSTELFCVAVGHEYQECGDPVEAMKRIVEQIPAEAVYLLLFRDEPEKIFIHNLNQRLAVGRDNAGTYLASSSLAFPEHVHEWCEIPANSIGIVSKDSLESIHYVPNQEQLVNGTVPAGLEDAFLSFVCAQPGKTVGQVVDGAVNDRFPKDSLVRIGAAGYQVMERLMAGGRIRAETHTVPGVEQRDDTPQVVLFPR